MVDSSRLDKIIDETIEIIEQSKQEIFEIAEMARTEYARIAVQLEEVKEAVQEIITQVDNKERDFRLARLRLIEVSRDFSRHSELAIKAAYEKAQVVQLELVVLKERESQLRMQRDELERSLRNLLHTVEKAENLARQVSVAMHYLQGNLKELGGELNEMQQRYLLGIRVMKALEEERRRVARDIHDGPAQTLAQVVLQAEICERLLDLDTESVRHELQELKEVLRQSIKDIRKVIYDLRPMTLDDLGLVPTLRRFIQDFNEQKQTFVEFAVTGPENRLPTHIEVGAFRVVQEALSNIRQHSQASTAVVHLEFGPSALAILIKDNGIGFDINEALQREGDHFGLLGMRERVELLQGTWQIDTCPGQGTKIMVRVPIKGVDADVH